jgi:hypothetical protein
MKQDNEKIAESTSSWLRKKWPWDWKNENLTDKVLVKILKNIYSYAKDIAYWYPTEPDFFYWFEGLKEYCRVLKDYFVKVAKEAPIDLKPKLSAISEQAFELLDMLMEWAKQKAYNAMAQHPDQVFYNIPYSEEELSNKWQTIVHKLNLCMIPIIINFCAQHKCSGICYG